MNLVLFGNNQTAAVAWAYFSEFSVYRVVGFTVDSGYMTGPRHPQIDLPVVPFEEVEKHFSPKNHMIYVSVAFQSLNRVREAKLQQAKAKGYKPASFISPHAKISKYAKIGEHNFIMEDNNIQPFVEIGDNNIIWSGNHIGHHTKIGNNNFIASHVVISGSVTIGDHCFFGVNSTIRDNISIADENIIGAGALMTKNTASGEVYFGQRATLADKPSSKVVL